MLILPKCPFCVVAYSSAVALCGVSGTISASGTHDPFTHTLHQSGWAAYLALAISVILASGILLTRQLRKDSRLLYILTSAFALFGTLVVAVGVFNPGAMNGYFFGVTLLIAATIIHSGVYQKLLQVRKWATFRTT
jgi:hypothetical protein